MKRFYTVVSLTQAEGGYHILLDGRPVKTKSGAFLCAANEALAGRIMQEWAAQDTDIVPDTMPLTQILNTRIDRVSKERDAMCAALLKYLDTDLICYFAAEPEALVRRQDEQWRVWLDWFEDNFGCALDVTSGLSALSQSDAAHDAVAGYVRGLDDDRFTVLQLVTSLSGSFVLGLAFLHGAASARQVLDACFVEETYKDALYDSAKYGADPMVEKAQKSKMRDLRASEDYLRLLVS